MSQLIDLLSALIRCRSVTPNDAGCQKIIAEHLTKLNFTLDHLRFGEVDNLFARYGTEAPLFVFAGHTDVVPEGPLSNWISDPYEPTLRDGMLFGRGAADMKSGLAAMIYAAEKFLQKKPKIKGSIAFLITSDEEGPSINGTKKVIEWLSTKQTKIDYCIIGEASSEYLLGDQIRVGRRGSLSGKLKVFGKQGHIAYPHLAENPIHLTAAAINDLIQESWDQGNDYFPPTTFQISNIHAGTGALNVIPGTLEIDFNFRFSTATTPEKLQSQVTKILEKYSLNFDLPWNLSGNPFLTKQGKLIQTTQVAIKKLTGLDTKLSTGGGTSDGRFIAPTGAEVIELGPCNSSVHQVNEHVRVADVEMLAEIYLEILERIL